MNLRSNTFSFYFYCLKYSHSGKMNTTINFQPVIINITQQNLLAATYKSLVGGAVCSDELKKVCHVSRQITFPIILSTFWKKPEKKAKRYGKKTYFQACFFFFSCDILLLSQRIQKCNKKCKMTKLFYWYAPHTLTLQ